MTWGSLGAYISEDGSGALQARTAASLDALQKAVPAVVQGGANAELPFPRHHFAVFIIFSWNLEMFWASLQTYLAAGWGKRIVIIDNSPNRVVVNDAGGRQSPMKRLSHANEGTAHSAIWLQIASRCIHPIPMQVALGQDMQCWCDLVCVSLYSHAWHQNRQYKKVPILGFRFCICAVEGSLSGL